MSWQELGARIAVDPLFRFGTNVEFVRVVKEDMIEFRIFERGCGPTTSSGTGTCASSAVAMTLRGAARKLNALAEGGAQTVVWPDAQSEMMLTGPAEIICVGEAW
jgi:diaminopimelate epimerase